MNKILKDYTYKENIVFYGETPQLKKKNKMTK